jgi:hypothetical protein
VVGERHRGNRDRRGLGLRNGLVVRHDSLDGKAVDLAYRGMPICLDITGVSRAITSHASRPTIDIA